MGLRKRLRAKKYGNRPCLPGDRHSIEEWLRIATATTRIQCETLRDDHHDDNDLLPADIQRHARAFQRDQ